MIWYCSIYNLSTAFCFQGVLKAAIRTETKSGGILSNYSLFATEGHNLNNGTDKNPFTKMWWKCAFFFRFLLWSNFFFAFLFITFFQTTAIVDYKLGWSSRYLAIDLLTMRVRPNSSQLSLLSHEEHSHPPHLSQRTSHDTKQTRNYEPWQK